MKIEKLRNNHKKEIIIGTLLTVVIGGTLTFRLTHSKYRVTQSIDLGSGVINYKVSDFKIMAMYKSEDGTNYIEMALTERMPGNGYVIDDNKSYCNLNGSKDTSAVLKTIDGNHVMSNLIKGDKCYLYFKKGGSYAADKILTNLGTSIKTSIPTFSSIATGDEVYSTSDGMYGNTTYYWRGAVTDNYVKFAGFCWRIIRINGDKSIRMIYDGSSCHANGTKTNENIAVTNQFYNANYNQSNYVGWTYTGTSQRTTGGTASNAKIQTESWYTSNITGKNATKVADGKFCNNRNAGSGYSWSINGNTFYYAGRTRLEINKTPTFNCPSGDVYTLKVGLITADEVAFAGGVYGTNNDNTSYYLYNGQNYWTMSPSYWGGVSSNVFIADSKGFLNSNDVRNTLSLRPVINLRADTTFVSGGTGTQSNPYVVQ